MAVNPLREKIRWISDPSVTDISISAWPSIEPTRPRSACSRASRTSSGRRNALNRMAIIRSPPMNSASVNCHPSSRTMMIPSSMTRFVDANSKVMAAVKLAPLRKIDRASATAAYEHEDDAAPRPEAISSVRVESSGRSRLIADFETTAWTIADNPKPRTSAQRISQDIANAKPRAAPIAVSTPAMVTSVVRGRSPQPLPAQTLSSAPGSRHRGVRQRACVRKAVGRDHLKSSEREHHQCDDDQEDYAHCSMPSLLYLFLTLGCSWLMRGCSRP